MKKPDRRLTDLRKSEVNALLNEIVAPKAIQNLKYDKERNEITATVITEWTTEEGMEDIEDDILLTEERYKVDWIIPPEEIRNYRMYLYALGINPLSKENPYMKDSKNKENKANRKFDAKKKEML